MRRTNISAIFPALWGILAAQFVPGPSDSNCGRILDESSPDQATIQDGILANHPAGVFDFMEPSEIAHVELTANQGCPLQWGHRRGPWCLALHNRIESSEQLAFPTNNYA